MAEITIDNPIKLARPNSMVHESTEGVNVGNLILGKNNQGNYLCGKIYTGSNSGADPSDLTENTEFAYFTSVIKLKYNTIFTDLTEVQTVELNDIVLYGETDNIGIYVCTTAGSYPSFMFGSLGKPQSNMLFLYEDESSKITLYIFDNKTYDLVELVNSGSVGQEYATKSEVTQSKTEAISESKSYTDSQIKTNVTDKLGKADGIASLNSSGKIPTTQLQLPEGTSLLAGLDAGGKIPSKNLPSYVDDVIELLGCCQESTGAGVGNTIDDFLYTNDITPKQGDMIGVPMPTTNTFGTFGLYTYNGSNWVRGSVGPGYGFEKDKIYIILYSNSWNDTSGPGWSGNFPANTCWRYSGSSAGTDSLIRVGGSDTAELESDITALETWKTSLNKDSANTLSYDNTSNKLSFIPINLGNGNNGTKLEVTLPEASTTRAGLLSKLDKLSLNNIQTLDVDQAPGQSIYWGRDELKTQITGKGLTILLSNNKPAGYCWSFGVNFDMQLYFNGIIYHSDSASGSDLSDPVDIKTKSFGAIKQYIKFVQDDDELVEICGISSTDYIIYDPSSIVTSVELTTSVI